MTGNRKYPSANSLSRKTNQLLNQFWAGFIIYIISYTLMISGAVTPKVTYLQLLGLLIFIIPAVRLIRFKIENPYLRNIYIIYCGWMFFVIQRGFTFNTTYLFDKLTDCTFGLFLYLVPFVLLLPKDLIYLKKVINVILILSVFHILCDLIFMKALLNADDESGLSFLENFSRNLGIPCGFILLTIGYQNDKKKNRALFGRLWVLFVIILTLLLAIIRARRGLIFMSLNILVVAYIMYNYAHRSSLFFKFFPLLILFCIYVYAGNKPNNKKSGTFSLITQRFDEDTRSGVVDYFYHDMTRNDWIIGKGIDGSYYCPSGATEDGYRGVIETDYLQIILKGGIISLGLLLLIAIPAIFKGLFYSKNILSKAAACWILLWLIALFPATVTTFSLTYLLVWISIGICYSKEIRNMPENLVKEYFQYKLFARK